MRPTKKNESIIHWRTAMHYARNYHKNLFKTKYLTLTMNQSQTDALLTIVDKCYSLTFQQKYPCV